MLHKKISLSLQVNRLSLPARLLFTWMICHADDEGRLKGDPEYVKATVVPMTKWSLKVIKDYFFEIKNQGLIYYWEENKEWFIEFVKWNNYQQIRKDRFEPSTLPSFNKENDNQLPTNRQPDDDQVSPQSNISEYSEIEFNKSECNEDIEIADDEIPFKGSELTQAQEESHSSFKRIGDPNQYEIKSPGQLAAKEVWQEFEPGNQRAFFTTYLKACMRGVPAEKIYQFASEMRQDQSIKNYGAIFNKKVNDYLGKGQND